MGRFIATAPVEKIYFGNDDGDTFLWNNGTNDNSSAINGEILTKEYLLALPHQTIVKDITTLSEQRVNALVRYQFDRTGDWHSLNDITSRFCRLIFKTLGKANSIRLRITDNSKNTSIIEGFNFHHKPQPDKRE